MNRPYRRGVYFLIPLSPRPAKTIKNEIDNSSQFEMKIMNVLLKQEKTKTILSLWFFVGWHCSCLENDTRNTIRKLKLKKRKVGF